MHELAIAESIVQTVVGEMERKGYTRGVAVRVRVGKLAAVVPEALEFGFEVITQGTALEGARLDIETVSVVARCRRCERSFPVEENVFICPHCGGIDIAVTQGDELEIVHFEIADNGTE